MKFFQIIYNSTFLTKKYIANIVLQTNMVLQNNIITVELQIKTVT